MAIEYDLFSLRLCLVYQLERSNTNANTQFKEEFESERANKTKRENNYIQGKLGEHARIIKKQRYLG